MRRLLLLFGILGLSILSMAQSASIGSSAPACTSGQFWPPAYVGGDTNAWVVCDNGTVHGLGGGAMGPTGATGATGPTGAAGGAAVDTRPQTVSSTASSSGAGVPVAANGSYTLFSAATGTAGTITFLHISLSGDSNAVQNSTLAITCNGGATQTVDLGLYFTSMDFPNEFATNWLSFGGTYGSCGGTCSNVTMNRRAEINYTNGCSVVFTNGSSSAGASIYAEVTSKVGSFANRASRNIWHSYCYNASVLQYANYPWLPTVSSGGPGELESLSLWVSAGGGIVYEQGQPVVTTDGNVAVTANGTEDFFGNGWNGGSGFFHTDKWGFQLPLAHPANTEDMLSYRFFTASDSDNVFYTASLGAYWPNGESWYGSGGTVTARSCATYWTTD